MLKRLFGRGKPARSQPTPPAHLTRPEWHEPHNRYLDYFNLHLHNLTMQQTVAALNAKYLTPAPAIPALLLCQHDEWITVYCSPPFVATTGFNRIASEIARQHNIWLIGYRVYAGEGIDVHYFHGAEHVAGLAVGQGELERQPTSPEIFAPLADVSTVIPRPELQHPLDFHFALLAKLGIQNAALTWEEVLQQVEMGELPEAILLPATGS